MTDFEAIYIRYFDRVYRYVFSLCANETVAKEIAQETFYKAMNHIDRFGGKCSLSVWLCQIAKNTFYTYAKRQKRSALKDPAALDKWSEASLESAFLDKETARDLHRLLHRMKEPYKEVFSLRVFGELPFSQIGELFGKTDSWARLVFYRAKNELRRHLNESSL